MRTNPLSTQPKSAKKLNWKRSVSIIRIADENDSDTDGSQPETNPKDAKANTGAAGPGAAKTPRQNSAIYVTGLPDDIDADELRDFFGKYGIIAESLDDNGKRIKLYNDKDGKFTGEALISEL